MGSVIKESICIITPTEKQIDITNATTFGLEITKLLNENYDFIINLENINFMDSSGLGKIIEAIRMAKESNKQLVFCQIRDAVKVLFNMVNLSQIAILYDTLEEAEQKLRL